MSADTQTPDYPVGPEGQLLPGQFDLNVYTDGEDLILWIYPVRTGGAVDDDKAPADRVCRRYETTDTGVPPLGTRRTPCPLPEEWVDTWFDLTAENAEVVATTLATQEPDLADYRDWVATAAAEMVKEQSA